MTNPYNFVQFPSVGPDRQEPESHNAVTAGLHSGVFTCRVIALSPIFIPSYESPGYQEVRYRDGNDRQRSHKIFRKFFSDAAGKPVIPGSELKGCFRAAAEAAGNGCVSVFNGVYAGKMRDDRPVAIHLPAGHEPCTDRSHLCPTCRLFGMSSQSNSDEDALFFKGKVSFGDARLVGEARYLGAAAGRPAPLQLLTTLSSPKPYHKDWYAPTGLAAGRKFYLHRDNLDLVLDNTQDARYRDELLAGRNGPPRNSYLHLKVSVSPLDQGSTFEFQVRYTNLTDQELALLVFAIELMPDRPAEPKNLRWTDIKNGHYHKIGYGKPAGLGTCAVYIVEQQVMDPARRYGAAEDTAGNVTGAALEDWLLTQKKGMIFSIHLPGEEKARMPAHVLQLLILTKWKNGKAIAYPQQNSNEFTNPLLAPRL